MAAGSGLTAEQKDQLEITQFKEFMTTYNNVTENCFKDCIMDFTSRKIQKQEVICSEHCVDKFIKMSQRVTTRLQEHFTMQMNASSPQS